MARSRLSTVESRSLTRFWWPYWKMSWRSASARRRKFSKSAWRRSRRSWVSSSSASGSGASSPSGVPSGASSAASSDRSAPGSRRTPPPRAGPPRARGSGAACRPSPLPRRADPAASVAAPLRVFAHAQSFSVISLREVVDQRDHAAVVHPAGPDHAQHPQRRVAAAVAAPRPGRSGAARARRPRRRRPRACRPPRASGRAPRSGAPWSRPRRRGRGCAFGSWNSGCSSSARRVPITRSMGPSSSGADGARAELEHPRRASGRRGGAGRGPRAPAPRAPRAACSPRCVRSASPRCGRASPDRRAASSCDDAPMRLPRSARSSTTSSWSVDSRTRLTWRSTTRSMRGATTKPSWRVRSDSSCEATLATASTSTSSRL